MSEITSPPVRYTGSKWRIAKWIISHFPKHVCYVEPFCGGASVLLRKYASEVEVINDIDFEVINFFRVIREQTDEFIKAITLTPYSRHELLIAHEPTNDPLEKARRFYIRTRQKFNGGQKGHTGSWRYMTTDEHSPLSEWRHQSHLWHTVERLRNVYIECDDAFKIIDRYDAVETLFFCDPPYLEETRTGGEVYENEMQLSDHIRLAQTLNSVQGAAIISGYDSSLYRDLYSGWKSVSIKTFSIKKIDRTETIWISPRAQANHAQRRLF